MSVHAASEFADKTDLLVVTQPLGGRYKTLRTNGGGNTKRRGARAIGVEIPVNCQYSAGNVDVRGVLLVHLVDQFVLRVSERSHAMEILFAGGSSRIEPTQDPLPAALGARLRVVRLRVVPAGSG